MPTCREKLSAGVDARRAFREREAVCEFRTAKSQQHERGSWPLSQKGNELGFVAFDYLGHYFVSFSNGS